MLTFGILLTLLIGFSTIHVFSLKFGLCEKLGLAFPIGIGLQTFLMLLLNMLGIPLSLPTVLAGSMLFACGLVFLLFKQKAAVASHYKNMFKRDFSQYNLLWLFLLLVIGYFEYMNFAKCMYYPTFDRDSLAGFDTIGFLIAQEHTFSHLSIFDADYMPQIHKAGSYISYIPLVQLSYAYVYLLGAATSKLVPALMFLSLLIAFYGSMSRTTGRTGAALITLLMLITPEMIAFSSLSATNVIHAVYASMGIIYMALWFKEREQKDLYLGSLLLALNVWTRMDGVAFIGAALLAVGVDALRTKHYKPLLAPALALLPVLVWGLFGRIYGLTSESIAILHPFWDSEKASLILDYFGRLFSNTTYYGYTFAAAFVSFLLNGWFLIKKQNNLPLLLMFVTAALLYMISLYQINYLWDSIHNVLAYSAKRFLFCFVPLAWYYAASNEWAVRLFRQTDRWLALKKESL